MQKVIWQFPLVGGQVEVVLYDVDEKDIQGLFNEIRDEGLRLQRVFNFYDPTSELSRLNRQRELRVSKELRSVIVKALRYCEQTNGLYDITRGKQLLQHKRGEQITPVSCSYRDVEIDGDIVSLTHPDIMLDLGSIAKGYIVDRILSYIKRAGIEHVLVDATGDMRISGQSEVINVQDPRDTTRTITPFILEEMAVATSGDYKQYSRTYDESHIFGSSDLASVTVVAPTAAEADVLATALFVLGSTRAGKFLAQLPHAHALLITKNRVEIMLNDFGTFLAERVQTIAKAASLPITGRYCPI